MKFTQTPVEGAYVIDVERICDSRGYFGRLWCEDELKNQGLESSIVQSNVGFSPIAGTLRGLHYQKSPSEEVKIVRCTRGSVFDVVLDIRRESPTFGKWHGVVLSCENTSMLYVPRGCATGYLTLEDNSEIYYHASESFAPDAATGVRFDDPAFEIQWPEKIVAISDNDKNWPDFNI